MLGDEDSGDIWPARGEAALQRDGDRAGGESSVCEVRLKWLVGVSLCAVTSPAFSGTGVGGEGRSVVPGDE